MGLIDQSINAIFEIVFLSEGLFPFFEDRIKLIKLIIYTTKRYFWKDTMEILTVKLSTYSFLMFMWILLAQLDQSQCRLCYANKECLISEICKNDICVEDEEAKLERESNYVIAASVGGTLGAWWSSS